MSIVFRGAPGASEQTRARVLEVAGRLGFSPNRAAADAAGYEALYLNKKNGNDLGGGKPVLTGPSFVDSPAGGGDASRGAARAES